jgi:hypothetical protein
MSEAEVTKLLTAIDIAAFKRGPAGSFTPVAPAPRWFERLVADTTFPFLGHILEEARLFWLLGTPGYREWGPSVDVDERGREFHYRVVAVVVADAGDFLLFQLDPGSDRMREVLQKVREQALVGGAGAPAALGQVRHEVRRATERIHDLLRPLLATGLRDQQFELWKALSAVCEDLVQTVDALAGGPANPGAAPSAGRKP